MGDSMRSMTERRKEIETEGGKVVEETDKKQEVSKELQEAILGLKKEVDEISKEETALKSDRIEVDQQLQKWDDAIKDNSKKVSYWKREIKKLDLQDVPGEEVTPLPTEITDEEILAINMEELNYELTGIDENLAKSKPNMAAIAEYKKKEEVYLDRVSELDKITSARDEQRKHHDDLRKQRLNDFMEGFAIITGKLKEMCSVSDPPKNHGKTSRISQEEKKHCHPLPLYLRFIIINLLLFMSWTKLMLLSTLKMFPLWQTTSRREPGMLNSSSFL